MGKVLVVDLSQERIEKLDLDENLARKYLGGNGFAAKFLLDNVPLNVAPLSEENAVGIATGPITGTSVWGSGRGHLAALSPQTNYFADSNFGGNFANAFKKTGFDAVYIKGKASSPVYVMIDEDNVSLKDASDLWGKMTEETHHLLMEKEGKDIESACIGPAGENGVLYSSIICSGKRVSAAGRGGIGSVLGFKNCKAIAVKGSKEIVLSDKDRLREYIRSLTPSVKEKSQILTRLGTPFLVHMINNKGMLCTRNNNRETFDKAHFLSGELIEEKYKKKNIACKGCPIACGKLVSVTKGEYANQHVKMAEYETIYAMGSMLENSDIVSIFNANNMCDQMGMDTITYGVTLSFLAECLEKGLFKDEELNKVLYFGDNENITELARKTGLKQGIGELISLGSAKIAEQIGGEAPNLLYSVKGLEMAGHSARGIRNMGLAYSTSTRGGSHHDARAVYNEPEGDPGFKGHPAYNIRSQHNTALGDSLVICRFLQERGLGLVPNESMIPLIEYSTGWKMEMEEIEQIGERIYNLERYINTERGLTRQGDMLPYRVMNNPIPEGPSKGRYVPENELNNMLDEYYQLRGWDNNGIPKKEKLKELEIL